MGGIVNIKNQILWENHTDRKAKLFLMFLLFIPCLFISTSLNNDIWFLLNSGRYVLNTGIPHIEPFTMHANLSFVMQQWLTATIFWFAYSNFGPAGLFFVVAVVYACIIFTLFKLCMRISENFFISFAVTMMTSVLISLFMITRPYIFSSLILALELYLLESFIQKRNPVYLAFLPILSILMINLHASMWPMLFVILIPYIIDSFHFKLFFVKGQG